MTGVEEVLEMLSKLTPEEVLAYWVEGELAEAEFYQELAARAEALGLGKELVDTFRRLAEESLDHSRELKEELVKRGSAEVTGIPSLEVASVEDALERADQIGEVLLAAMEGELAAHMAYKFLAKRADDEELRRLYLKLAEVELGHYEDLKREYEKLGGGNDG